MSRSSAYALWTFCPLKRHYLIACPSCGLHNFIFVSCPSTAARSPSARPPRCAFGGRTTSAAHRDGVRVSMCVLFFVFFLCVLLLKRTVCGVCEKVKIKSNPSSTHTRTHQKARQTGGWCFVGAFLVANPSGHLSKGVGLSSDTIQCVCAGLYCD